MRVIVVGAGSMGSRHGKTVKAVGDLVVGVVDPIRERAISLAAMVGGIALAPEAPWPAADAVIVASPPDRHLEAVKRGLAFGARVLVEKPVGLPNDLGWPDRNVVVGMVERFHPVWNNISPKSWQEVSFVRTHPGTGRGEDVPIQADLLIHDLDLLERYVGRIVGLERAAMKTAHTMTVAGITANGVRFRIAVSRRAARCRELSWHGSEGTGVRNTLNWGDGPDPLTRQWLAFRKGNESPTPSEIRSLLSRVSAFLAEPALVP